MTTWSAVFFSILVGVGLYHVMGDTVVKKVLGLAFLSHASLLLLLMSGGLKRSADPIMSHTESLLPASSADPLPQALILTAIVIGLGLQIFLLAILWKGRQE